MFWNTKLPTSNFRWRQNEEAALVGAKTTSRFRGSELRRQTSSLNWLVYLMVNLDTN